MTLTVRLNAQTERAVTQLARRRRQTRSDVVRDALVHYAALHDPGESSGPYEAWADVIGVVKLGARDGRTTTGSQFATLVREKARARRPR